MYIAQAKRKENIAEYILYLWQLEDLLRALKFSPEVIYSQLVASQERTQEEKQALFLWYMELANLLREEGKETSGHLAHTMHLIADLQNLHLQLMELQVGKDYRALYARLAPELPNLREMLGRAEMSDMEIAFRALYGAMLYRLKGDQGRRQAIGDVVEVVSPVVAELARVYRHAEKGEIDLFEES